MQKLNASSYKHACKFKELVKLGYPRYPSFDSLNRAVEGKDDFVHGLHSEMQLVLKSKVAHRSQDQIKIKYTYTTQNKIIDYKMHLSKTQRICW